MSTDLSIDQIIGTVQALDGSLVVAPAVGDPNSPELAWGDAFFYYAPDGQMPRTVQPYGTVVTKDYPDDTMSDLDPEGRWRVNIHVDRATFRELTRHDSPGSTAAGTASVDHAATDVVLPHPVYGAAGWIAVVNPGPATADTVLRLLRDAHAAARTRYARRH
jgi:hypothetical protein